MITTFTLDGKTPVPEPDFDKWGEWWEAADRRVALESLEGFEVSTVFLGVGIPPNLFETIIFDEAGVSCGMWRYPTWEAAEYGHDAIAAWLRAGRPGDEPNFRRPL